MDILLLCTWTLQLLQIMNIQSEAVYGIGYRYITTDIYPSVWPRNVLSSYSSGIHIYTNLLMISINDSHIQYQLNQYWPSKQYSKCVHHQHTSSTYCRVSTYCFLPIVARSCWCWNVALVNCLSDSCNGFTFSLFITKRKSR